MISEGMSVCASDRCQIVVAKKIVLSDCRTKWVEFATQNKLVNAKRYQSLQVKLLLS